ncbi:DUF721 domain-containing protein [Candidatus Nomurabacteria bacterium]|nr:DUF721 domain-containing protein [Candidatus Nomurabacteria bacterium]
MDSLKDAIKSKMKGTALQGQLDATQVVEMANSVFEAIFPEDQVIHVKPLFLKNRTLTVSCSSSVVAQEIRLNQKKLVDHLNKKMGDKLVDRIRYLT